MKATTWLCPVLTLLCATRLACTAQRGSANGGSGSSSLMDYGYGYAYPLDDLDTNLLQDDYMLVKRNKPSLSIVNPLDVLRQRLLLEIARRQMKENTRQVELNRAILKNVGKRAAKSASLARRYRMVSAQQPFLQHQQQYDNEQLLSQLQQQQQQRQHYYYYPTTQQQQQQLDADMPPSTSIFDFLQQRPASASASATNAFGLETALNAVAAAAAAAAAAANEKNSLGGDAGANNKQHQVNGNEIGNETNHGHNNNNNNNNPDNNNSSSGARTRAILLGGDSTTVNSGTRAAGVGAGVGGRGHGGLIFVNDNTNNNNSNANVEEDEVGDDEDNHAAADDLTAVVGDENNVDVNDAMAGDNNNNGNGNGNAAYHQMRYLYRLHKNHRFARK